MRPSDLYSRLLLTLIAGCLLYIAGTLRTLVRQADTYAAQKATRPVATPVGWSPTQAAKTPSPSVVFLGGIGWQDNKGKWLMVPFDYQNRTAVPIIPISDLQKR